MTADVFDRHLRAIRRDRAARIGPELFLFERAFSDCLDRLCDISREFDRALLVGCPSLEWRTRIEAIVGRVDIVDPGSLFASSAGGEQVEEDRFDFGIEVYDLCVAIGTLDTVNDLPLALQLLRRSLRSDAPLIGAMAGGNSLSALRTALIEAGRRHGQLIARTHPRIEPQALAQLLSATGFRMPVVDVDRIRLRYTNLDALVRDLRDMAATAVLASRPPPMTKTELSGVREEFLAQGDGDRIEEIVEILHFLAWAE